MNRHLLIFILIIFSLGIVYFCQQEALFDKYAFNDDCNQYTFPYYKIKDSELFQDDIYTEYSKRYNVKGVVFIYSLFSRFVDPLLVSKVLPFILCSISALFIFFIGEKIKNTAVGILAAIMFTMHSWTFTSFSGGHAKAFVFPLLLGFIYYLLMRNYLAIVLILFLQIVLYPPIAMVSLFTIGLLLFPIMGQSKEEANTQMKFYLHMIVVGISLLFFLYSDRISVF